MSQISINDLLPVETRGSKEIIKALQSNDRVVLIRAPPGTGKTMTVLAYLFWLGLKGISSAMFFRTRAELDNGIRIANKIAKKIREYGLTPPDFIPIGGKDELCRFPPGRKELIRWWCSIINCDYFRRRSTNRIRESLRREPPQNLREFFVAARDAGACPYFAYQQLCEQARIVLATHPYFIQDELFNRLGFRDVLVIDEAHSFLSLITSRIPLSDYKLFQEYWREVEEVGSPVRIAVREWRRGAKDFVAGLSRYYSFMEAPGITIVHRNDVIKVCPPELLVEKRLGLVNRIIFMSSTLYPISLFKKLFGAETSTYIVPGLLKSTDKRLLLGLSIGLTTKYVDRSYLLQEYAKVIDFLLASIDRPTIIFTPSYEIAEELSRALSLPLVREEGSIDAEKIISVARGRLAEGIDVKLAGKDPELVIIAGLPFPDISKDFSAVVKVYSKYYKVSEAELLKAMSLGEMMSALVQALGRIGRRKRGIGIIIDDRIEKLGVKILIFKSVRSLINKVKKFLEKK